MNQVRGRNSDTSSPSTERYAILSPCGWGNLGDAAIIDSLLQAIRERNPGSSTVGYTLNWQDTEERHGIEAHPLTGFSLPYYPLIDADVEQQYTPPRYDGSAVSEGSTESGVRARVERGARRSRTAVSLLSFLVGAIRVRHERRNLRALAAELEGTTTIVVAGGGQLDALFGGFFGQPYVLWRWARVARTIGARFVVLSVGTGTLRSAERHLTCSALRHADYRSYRDPDSPRMLRDQTLTSNDPVVPDLAYALSFDRSSPPADTPLVVGVSPMNYQHPDFYPGGDRSRYEQHIAAMHTVCLQLLGLGHDVVLFTTDASDDVGLAELTRSLAAVQSDLPGTWRVAGARTVPELMAMYQELHAVVAARLHGVLLAHVAHKPVLALAHERKVKALMNDMGHDRLCLDLDAIDTRDIERGLRDLIEHRQELAADIAALATSRRRLVERQYDVVLGPKRSASQPL
jgi:polysaccharide pyruvyl transferase WcaK-like protein